MEQQTIIAICRAANTYFKSIGHIDWATDKQCKSWNVDSWRITQSDNDSKDPTAYVVEFDLAVFTDCEGVEKTCDGSCDMGESAQFIVHVETGYDADHLAQYALADPDLWILSKDRD
jgi:hypothetical protein